MRTHPRPGLAVLLLVCACARPSARAIARITAESDVKTAQRERFDAMMHQDVAALDTLLDDDFTYAHTGGRLESRKQFIGSIKKQQLVYEAITPSEVRVRVYDGLALATGRSEMRVRNSAGLNSFAIRFTEVYVRRDGHWLLTAWQAKRLVSRKS
jgi:ketosteroid isomerase-like protein